MPDPQKSDLRPDVEQKQPDTFCRDCKHFIRDSSIRSIGQCTERLHIVTDDTTCRCFVRRPR